MGQSVDYDFRLIFDYSFYKKVIKNEPLLLKKLMYINQRAKGNRKRFNILPQFIFDKILQEEKIVFGQV